MVHASRIRFGYGIAQRDCGMWGDFGWASESGVVLGYVEFVKGQTDTRIQAQAALQRSTAQPIYLGIEARYVTAINDIVRIAAVNGQVGEAAVAVGGNSPPRATGKKRRSYSASRTSVGNVAFTSLSRRDLKL